MLNDESFGVYRQAKFANTLLQWNKETALMISISDNLQIKPFTLKSKPRFPFPHQILFVSQKLLLSLPPKINFDC